MGFTLSNIDVEISMLKEFLTPFEKVEDLEHQATLLAHNLPDKAFIDKLMRYDSALERKKQNAIKVLLAGRGKKLK